MTAVAAAPSVPPSLREAGRLFSRRSRWVRPLFAGAAKSAPMAAAALAPQ